MTRFYQSGPGVRVLRPGNHKDASTTGDVRPRAMLVLPTPVLPFVVRRDRPPLYRIDTAA